MASSPITPWQTEGEKVATVRGFIFLGSKITADGDCSHEIKSCLLLGRKVMTNLDSILKSRDMTLPTKVHIVKAVVFLVVMYGWESWTIKKARKFQKNIYFCFIDYTKAFDCVDHNKLWKILKEIGEPAYLTSILGNRSRSNRTVHGTTDWLKIGEGVCQGYMSPFLFNFYAEYIMQNARLDEA